MPKSKGRTKESKNGELALIIEEFGRAMWNANPRYITEPHGMGPRFTPNMQTAWNKYVDFLARTMA